ncbi:hypothetical protein CWI42_010510 [Ordospora colligata]|uniref:CID domain-containing protein n=1 Tax=Ordospora colligata OC4 TaxID=1354746 RepID=A0A0B2UMA3_9MICR|nr:uncharacterized protein M896_010510 [Ordospora colligata OC4]KHN70399.1 hypothetical protein M896_010510 [Ordospora colligata OC4]TBU17149.1 hypothetical protein CWI41_010510 [Ordospora colligata]TBU17399.1 hypothetical protein CWI40_010510 [Ordospora colligata]TBU19579.1 hypothetical protein CWI42_010510 [Ordospora colligata]
MTSLSKEYLLKALMNLVPTEEQMKTIGLFIKTFKKDHSAILDAWMFVYERSSAYHRLNMLYLANEIMQTTRDADAYSVELKIAFKTAVLKVFEQTKQAVVGNAHLYKKYCELENVWIQRNVMGVESCGLDLPELIRNIERAFGDKTRLCGVLEDALVRIRSGQ